MLVILDSIVYLGISGSPTRRLIQMAMRPVHASVDTDDRRQTIVDEVSAFDTDGASERYVTANGR